MANIAIQHDRVKLDNLTIMYIDHDSSYSGEGTWVFPIEAIREYLVENDWELPYHGEDTEDSYHPILTKEDDWECHYADAALAICHFLWQTDSEWTVEFKCEHVYWCVHDAIHIKSHCTNTDVQVTKDQEQETHIEAFGLTYNAGYIRDHQYDLFCRIVWEENQKLQYSKGNGWYMDMHVLFRDATIEDADEDERPVNEWWQSIFEHETFSKH